MIEDYFARIQALLKETKLAGPPEVLYDRRDRETGYLQGDLVFKDGSRLHFREFVQVKRGVPVQRYMYAFQYMRANGMLIFRYDNAEHYPDLPSAPHHKHVGESEVVAAQMPDLEVVLKEIEALLD